MPLAAVTLHPRWLRAYSAASESASPAHVRWGGIDGTIADRKWPFHSRFSGVGQTGVVAGSAGWKPAFPARECSALPSCQEALFSTSCLLGILSLACHLSTPCWTFGVPRSMFLRNHPTFPLLSQSAS